MPSGNPGASGGGITTLDIDTSSELATILTDESGTGSVVFGTAAAKVILGTSAAGAGTAAVAIGASASASSTDAVAVGETAVASTGTGNIAIGSDAAASGTGGAISIGDGASASGNNSVVVGASASSNQTDGVAVGPGATVATAAGSIAIGGSTNANGTNSVCLGISSTTGSGATNSIALGRLADTSTFSNALCIGLQATAVANNDAQFGTSTQPYNFKTYGTFRMNSQALTAGTMTGTVTAQVRKVWHQFSWTNAMVVALGAATSGNVSVCTLPAKTIVTNAFVVITGAAAGPATVTVSLGRVGATYIDYIVASDAKAAANTVYGDAVAERGTGLDSEYWGDFPSYTGTTVVNAQFVSTGANLDTVTGSTGHVYLETVTLP